MGICASVKPNPQKKTQPTNPSQSTTMNIDKKPIVSGYICESTIHDDITKFFTFTKAKNIIGEGATGIVREAIRNDGTVFAIKTITKSMIKYKDILLNEISISPILLHENIIKCHEIYEDQINIHFVLDYIKGGDLLDKIITSDIRRLSEKQSFSFLLQILRALNYLHNDMNICHRDIKPENILIKYNKDYSAPVLKIIDFGFACYIPDKGYMTDRMGTETYLAPEMIEDNRYDSKVDLWSTGVLFMNMITGTQPFSSHPNIPIRQQILSKPINFNKIKNNNYKGLAMELLERNPQLRIDTAKALKMAESMILPENEQIEYEFKQLDPQNGYLKWQSILDNYNIKAPEKKKKIDNAELITFDYFCTLWKSNYIY